MANVWICLCEDDVSQSMRQALSYLDPNGLLCFASSAQDLRERVQQSPFGMGVLVGPLDGPISALNVAAAVVHDGLAADVAMATYGVTQGLRQRAQQAGVRTVLDLADLQNAALPDLDEPSFTADEVPTMVLGGSMPSTSSLVRVPLVGDGVPKDTDPIGHSARIGQIGTLSSDADAHNNHTLILGEEPLHALVGSEPPIEAEKPMLVGGDANRMVGDGDAPVVAFVSGRGGVGKTSLVAMMATVAGAWGMRVALCDLDLSCGNLYSCFGISGAADLAKVMGTDGLSADDVTRAGVRVGERSSLWGPCELPEMAEVVYPKVRELLDALAHTHDLVLVDTSSTFTDAVAQAVQRCDRLVITVDQGHGSAASQARVAALAVRLGVARTRMVRLANRCGSHGKGAPIINRADVGLETARPMRVLDGGPEVADCMAEGRMDELMDLGSRFAESSASVLALLLQELGRLPDCAGARRAVERSQQKSRWSFGRRREAM